MAKQANSMFDWFKTLNCYPPEYNRAVHGPFDPRRNYAFKDTPWTEVKLGELPGWLKRRNYSPRAIFQLIGRAPYRTMEHHVLPVRGKINILLILGIMTSVIGYVLQYNHLRKYLIYTI